jgi:thiamine biosynthesis lipoprotein
VVRLHNRALSVSGDYEQYFEYEGRRYSHILDPRTGWPARGIRSAAMLSDNATDTDAYSTAAFVGGEMIAREICERNPGMGCILLPEREPPNELEIMVIGEADLASPAEFDEE